MEKTGIICANLDDFYRLINNLNIDKKLYYPIRVIDDLRGRRPQRVVYYTAAEAEVYIRLKAYNTEIIPFDKWVESLND